MQGFPWQVVTRWVSDGGSEYTQAVAHATLADARREFDRLAPRWGVPGASNRLVSIWLVGEFDRGSEVAVAALHGATSWQ